MPRLPAFFHSNPALWFAQAELIFEASGVISQRYRAGAVVAALDCEIVQTFGDLLTNHNHVEKYTQIKQRMIENFSVSERMPLFQSILIVQL